MGGSLFEFATGTVCNCTKQLQQIQNDLHKEMQANISDVRKEIDALRNVTKLLLGQYVLPPGPPSMVTVFRLLGSLYSMHDVSVSIYQYQHSTFMS